MYIHMYNECTYYVHTHMYIHVYMYMCVAKTDQLFIHIKGAAFGPLITGALSSHEVISPI